MHKYHSEFLNHFVHSACHLRSYLDGQHDMCVALQHLHSITVADVLKAHSIGSQDLVPHLYPILLSQATRIQPGTTRQE